MSRSSTPPPELIRRDLDEAGVVAHFDALVQHATAIEVRVKQAPTAHSEPGSVGLDAALRQLLEREVLAVQVGFSEDGEWWCDTITRAGESFRLVRVRRDLPP